MTNREQEIQQKIIAVLQKQLAPDRIILFGSRGKGLHAPQADFDVALPGKSPGIDKMQQMRQELETVLGLYKVDVVFLNDVDPEFKQIILQTGKTLYEK
ncbi:nucleotidyltransferase domain-containing protein [bacterium]|nr:nucleotidyltransferase domain-containing protein [bacterium]